MIFHICCCLQDEVIIWMIASMTVLCEASGLRSALSRAGHRLTLNPAEFILNNSGAESNKGPALWGGSSPTSPS